MLHPRRAEDIHITRSYIADQKWRVKLSSLAILLSIVECNLEIVVTGKIKRIA